jgi:hypothetical protein
MAADVRQLVEPIHLVVRNQIVTHDPLLDHLRAAAIPGNTVRGQERRPIPQSKPPLRVDVADLLAGIYVGISFWRVKLGLPSPPEFEYGCAHVSCRLILLRRGRHGPPCARASIERVDWQKAMLRALVAEAPKLAPSIGDWLATEVAGWWRDAAVGSGWAPADLLKLR